MWGKLVKEISKETFATFFPPFPVLTRKVCLKFVWALEMQFSSLSIFIIES